MPVDRERRDVALRQIVSDYDRLARTSAALHRREKLLYLFIRQCNDLAQLRYGNFQFVDTLDHNS